MIPKTWDDFYRKLDEYSRNDEWEKYYDLIADKQHGLGRETEDDYYDKETY